MSDLKVCPWCGQTEHLRVQSVGSMTADMKARPYQVRCSHLDCEEVGGPVMFGRADAIAAWNTRAVTDTRIEAAVAEAVRAERAKALDRVIEAMETDDHFWEFSRQTLEELHALRDSASETGDG